MNKLKISFSPRTRSAEALQAQAPEAKGGLRFYRTRPVINGLKYHDMSATLRSCILGKLVSFIIWDYLPRDIKTGNGKKLYNKNP